MQMAFHVDSPQAKSLQQAIIQARERSLAWFESLQVPGTPSGVLIMSASHVAEQWPGMLLPGTYNAVMARDLLGDIHQQPRQTRESLASWLIGHRLENGVFRIPGMKDEAVFKKPRLADTWQYIDFHVTNYSLGAVQALCPDWPKQLSFARPFLEPQFLQAWLSERDLRDPWQEGNNIVNLGSFLLQFQAQDGADGNRAGNALEIMFDWHERLQEPGTGFWGVGQAHNATALLHAMAGSMHNYHLWYFTDRVLPYQDKAIDYALTQPPKIHSACIDADLVDLLVHGRACSEHRQDEIDFWLFTMLGELLRFQHEDGGFADEELRPGSGLRKQDGWVKGYTEPQGISNTFATWFRWIAIAMAARSLWPEWDAFPGGWRFRPMVGIGYAKLPAQHGART
jgi:hypothetical protein